jgi:hypothetical protein
MTRSANNILALCLFSLSATVLAHASEYPFLPGNQVDISVNDISIASTNGSGANETLNLTGSSVILPDSTILPGGQVATIIDLPGTSCNGSQCSIGLALSFTANASGFTITGQTVAAYNANSSATTPYLSGTFVAGSFLQDGSNYGELFDVTETPGEVAEWTALEEAFPNIISAESATDLNGDQIALDFDSDSGGTADMEPWTSSSSTPEPATLTLLCSGLAAGLLRKRLARNKK